MPISGHDTENRFSSEIPGELSKCLVLEHLNMSHNFFQGSIPDSFSSLKGLQVMDLSHNKLSGNVPQGIQNLSNLQWLDLSFNMLDGEVPTGGVFKNQSGILLIANKGLCGGIQELKLPLCPTLKNDKHRNKFSTKAKIVVSLVSVFFLAIAVGLTYLIIRCKRPKEKRSSASSMTEGYLRLSYKQLLDATEGFASSNLIGQGSFCSVYKGVLPEYNRLIAVKVMNLERRGAMKSFEAECSSLRQARHRNILKILTSCSSIDFKGDDFLALVYELMPNGSLDDWLHKSGNLTLCQRVDVAIDIANALIYLHQDCEPRIVHCDLKPRNVLFDNEMVAHVGDFGLARIVADFTSEFSTNSTISSVVKGSIGYVAPEYGVGEKPSRQGDTFSYGIILLEMVTGKRPADDMFTGDLSLHAFAKQALPERIIEIMDLCLLEELQGATGSSSNAHNDASSVTMSDALTSIVIIGVACSLESPIGRMSLDDALKQLQVVKRNLSNCLRI